MNTRPDNNNKNTGFSLIELMVAMLLGLFISAGAIKIYAANKDTYLMQEAMTETQKNGRFILNRVGNKIQNAGYSAFLSSYSNGLENVLTTPGDDRWNLSAPVFGQNNVAASDTVAGITGFTPGSDVIMLKAMINPFPVASNNSATAVSANSTATPFTAADIAVIADHDRASLVQIASTDTTTTPGQTILTLTTGTTVLPGQASTMANRYSTNAVIGQLDSYMYYLKNGDNGRPALFEAFLETAAGSAPAMTERELVPNVDDLQIVYGIDQDDNGIIDAWNPANTVSNNNNWANVKNVGVALLLSNEKNRSANAPNSWTFDEDDFTFTKDSTPGNNADKRFRRVFRTYITIKNV